MIDVESVRRNFSAGPYDAPKTDAYLPFMIPNLNQAARPSAHMMDVGSGAGHRAMEPGLGASHRALVHWNHQPVGLAPHNGTAPQPTTETPRSDEDDDDDDEDRPFTPPPPRERLSYTRYQLELLNAIYKQVRYPNSTQKQLVAKRVGITREQVKIWFQNRRRKDVVCNSTKAKSCEASPGSTCSADSKDSIQSSPSRNSAEHSSSEEGANSNDSAEIVVPDVVLKSVINELLKFVNDPLKGKKKKKKRSKSKKVNEKVELKKGLAQTLLRGDYDMISPPNQITPTAFFEKVKKGFNHAKGSSAFANPRDLQKPAQISNVSSTSDLSSLAQSQRPTIPTSSAFSEQFPHPLPSQQSHLLRSAPSGIQGVSNGCDIPVLSDLLSYKSACEARHKSMMNAAANNHFSPVFSPPSTHQMPRSDLDKNHHPGMNGLIPGRPLGGMFPYPFLAEHPVLLSSLRQPDQILRPAPQYPGTSVSDDPYQPLLVTSLSNPYFAPPATSWSMAPPKFEQPGSSTYTQL